MVERSYLCLKKQEYTLGEYSLVPIRDQDKYLIMKWRNEQIYHLRQQNLLTKEDQDRYFETVVKSFFKQTQPANLLFSYLRGDACIGYGGLVHINWKDRHAEISFIMDTKLEKNEFELHWVNYLSLLNQIAGQGLKFKKIFTYAFDLRPHLYDAVEKAGYTKEAVLKDHCYFENRFIDVVIHSMIFPT